MIKTLVIPTSEPESQLLPFALEIAGQARNDIKSAKYPHLFIFQDSSSKKCYQNDIQREILSVLTKAQADTRSASYI